MGKSKANHCYISNFDCLHYISISGRNLEFTDQKKRDEWIRSELKTYGSNLSDKEEQLKTVEKEVQNSDPLIKFYSFSIQSDDR